jgi:hypothetical protein
VTPVVEDIDNVVLLEHHGHGAFVCPKIGVDTFEVHTLFLPEGRGPVVKAAVRDGLDYLFTSTDCRELVTKVPQGNEPAAGLARYAGFQLQFVSPTPWTTPDEKIPMEFFAMSVEQWALKSDAALEAGRWLHGCIDATLDAHGSTLPHHPDDEVHNRMAGAAALMVQAGQTLKGVTFYNRWARWACYQPLVLLSEHPPILDLGGIVVELHGHEMRILSCR